jgi:hypothetical protein
MRLVSAHPDDGLPLATGGMKEVIRHMGRWDNGELVTTRTRVGPEVVTLDPAHMETGNFMVSIVSRENCDRVDTVVLISLALVSWLAGK